MARPPKVVEDYPERYKLPMPSGLREHKREVLTGVDAAKRRAWNIRTEDKDKRYAVYERQTGDRYVFLPDKEQPGEWQLVEIGYNPESREWMAAEANNQWYNDYPSLREAKRQLGIL
jgi:hypothetical protein